MSNGHDKTYRVISLEGQNANQIKTALDQAELDGFNHFKGMNDSFIVLYAGKS